MYLHTRRNSFSSKPTDKKQQGTKNVCHHKTHEYKREHIMIEHTQILNEITELNQSIEEHLNRINNRLKNAPPGSLRINTKSNKHQYYHRINPSDPQGKYLPRKDHCVAVRLAQKDYDQKLLKTLSDQQTVLLRFMKEFAPDAAMQVYENLSKPRKELVRPEFLNDEDFIELWLNMPYQKLGFSKNDPEYYTAKGERVRSKSEILIADALFRHNIPYRYEYPVYDNGVIIAAPDFNCLNVRLRKDYYWEHLGKLGDPDYSNRNVSKLEKYTFAGDFDESSLILTFETDSHPLNTKVIEEKIKKYLL